MPWNIWCGLLSEVARTIFSWNDCYMKKLFVVLGLGGVSLLLIVFELNLLVSYLERHRLPASFMDNGYNHETLEALRKHADEGMIYAEYRLGQKYFVGDGVQRDVNQAIVWFLKATDAGDIMSPYWLGMMYANGDGMPEDAAESVKWATHRRSTRECRRTMRSSLDAFEREGGNEGPYSGGELVSQSGDAI